MVDSSIALLHPSGEELLFASVFIGMVSFVVLSQFLTLPIALLISAIKVSLPLVYFAYWDLPWLLKDDVSYFQQGMVLWNEGMNPFVALFSESDRNRITVLANSAHMLYAWWNLLAVYCFGPSYSSPVLLNVFATILTAGVFYRLLRLLGRPSTYASAYVIFFTLHWELISWSSIVNIKDILVMFLLTSAIYFASAMIFQKRLTMGIGLVFVLVALSSIRMYLPALVLSALVTWIITQQRSPALLATSVLIFGFVMSLAFSQLAALQVLKPGLIFSGFLKFLVAPLPWQVEEGYSFLKMAAIMNFLFLPTLIFGLTSIWKELKPARFVILVAMFVIVFIAIFPELTGARHRLQILPIIAWLQFHALWKAASIVIDEHYSDKSLSMAVE